MFKVQENGDGSTSIFCNKTGKLICTIKSQQKAMGLGCRPVNVVEPSPKPRSCCYNLDIKSEVSSDSEDKKLGSRRSLSPVSVESKEDFTDECITPDDFARCLNLIPKEKLKNGSLDELKSSFPLRHLSRTKKVRIHKELQDLKLPDDLPLTSCLGVKLLKLNPQKNFCNDETILLKIKNYDSFCRFQLNTPSVCGNFPKLRCREKKEYPVHTSQKILKYEPTHIYTFGRSQRLERMITLKTGLDARSRKLLRKCNKKLLVSIKKLTAQEIHHWLQKKSKIIRPLTTDYIRELSISVYSDSEATVIDENSVSGSSESSYIDVLGSSSSKSSRSMLPVQKQFMSFSGLLTDSGKCLSPLGGKSMQHSKLIKDRYRTFRECYVKLNNVLKNVCKSFDGYYVDGTSIRIPFLSEYLSSVNPKVLTSNFAFDNHISSPRYDHAYHRPISEEISEKKLLSNSSCLNHKTGKIKSIDSVSLKKCKRKKSTTYGKLIKQNSNATHSLEKRKTAEAKEIPVIDLTGSSVKETVSKTIFVSSYIFCCYACNSEKKFTKKSELDICISKHMKDYHHVSNPELFLQSCYDTTKLTFTFEAFPGYKKNLVG